MKTPRFLPAKTPRAILGRNRPAAKPLGCLALMLGMAVTAQCAVSGADPSLTPINNVMGDFYYTVAADGVNLVVKITPGNAANGLPSFSIDSPGATGNGAQPAGPGFSPENTTDSAVAAALTTPPAGAVYLPGLGYFSLISQSTAVNLADSGSMFAPISHFSPITFPGGSTTPGSGNVDGNGTDPSPVPEPQVLGALALLLAPIGMRTWSMLRKQSPR